MRVTKSLVEKLRIEDAAPHISVINVFFEDYGEQRGKVTIESDGDAWSYFWGAMGEGYTVKSFFAKADSDYIIRKLSIGIDSTIDDESQEALELKAKQKILLWRREKSISKETAREHWDLSYHISDFGKEHNADILSEIFGSEWYDRLPQIPNPKYNHLLKIVESIKAAIQNY